MISCRKGENDPLISLHTRKSRVAGTWKLDKASVIITIKGGNTPDTDETIAFTSSDYVLDAPAVGFHEEGASSLEATFEKDGTFKLKQKLGNYEYSGNGTWDFGTGAGEAKKKADLHMNIMSMLGTSDVLEMFNKTQTSFVYSIRELRSKKMVLENEEQLVIRTSGLVEYRITSEYTFIQ
jgi:hypothetical protein